ncbi:hypothetical protein IE53DRAFT_389207 [Violaceomyces palustris]|uniref:Uncharacterized protein n=1 Tax=Violaceomyces palustris TaxID=1673888 RepID=A0ACD0NS57_9BASI|nr:hypothetical protein IE53DRAFT_389207 [Violaceomyces palustris]
MGLVPKDSNETLVLEDDEHGALVELLCQHHDWHQAQWYLRRFGITNEKGARLAWLNLTKKFKLFLVGADDFFRVVYGEREPNPEPVSKEVYMVYHINKQKYYQSIIKFGENFYNHLDEDHVRNAIEDNRSRGEIPERRYSTSETGEVSMAPFYTVGEDFTCSSSDQAVVRRDQNPTLRHLFD